MTTVKRSLFSSLRTRLLIALLVLSALPALLIGGLAYRNARDTVEKRVMAHLTSVADLKKEQISAWLELTRADTRLLADNFLNQEHFSEIIDPQTDPQRRAAFTGFVTDNLIGLQKARAGYTEIAFVDTTGKVILATDPAHVGADLPQTQAVRQTFASPSGEFVEDIHREAAGGSIEMTFGRILYAVDLPTATVLPQVNGAVIIRVDMNQTIYPLLGSWPGMGATGETLLVRRDGDSSLFLDPLVFYENAALNLRIPIDSPNAKPAYLASIGQEGILQTPDYRGVPVLAAYRFIPPMDWGFVAKEDQSEAFAPVTDLARQWLLVTGLVLLAAVAVAVALARVLIGPLTRLVVAAQDVAAGKPANHLPISEMPADEIGQLAAAFQAMAVAVRQRQAALESHIEELNVLNELGREMAATLDLPEIASRVVTRVAGCFGDFHAQLWLYDTVSQELVAYASAGRDAASIQIGKRAWLGQGLLGLAALKRQTQLTQDAPTYSAIALPIVREEELLGVLGVSSDDPNGFGASDIRLLETLASQLASPIQNAHLFRDLGESYDHTLDALVAALDARDKETEGHSRRVVLFTLALAQRMGIPENATTDIRRGALLHDIGKIGVSDAILLKPGALTEEERAIMRQHPAWGERILTGIPFLQGATEIVCAHHERWDGKGYPQALAGEEIPRGARIFAVADTFDAITSDRPYRAALPYSFARQEILAGSGTQFDPEVVRAFLQIAEDEWTHLRAETRNAPIADGPLPLGGNQQSLPLSNPGLQALSQLIASLNGLLDLGEVLREAARTSVELLGAAVSAIFLFDAETDRLTLAAECGLPDLLKEAYSQFPVKGFHNERVVRESCTVLHNSIEDVTAFVRLGLFAAHPGLGSYLCVPLTAKGVVTGIMGIVSRSPHRFETQEIQLYQVIGAQIGLGILNARAYESMHRLAITDGLTGAYNRRSLDDFLRKEMQRCFRYQRGVSLLLLDIDDFKMYNDLYGHLAGDEALRQVAALLKTHIRAIDVVARYGGEEFAIVLPETDTASALAVAEKLRKAIEAHSFPQGVLTVSTGLSFCPAATNTSSPTALIARADQALYNAKQTGRNRVCVWASHADLWPWSDAIDCL